MGFDSLYSHMPWKGRDDWKGFFFFGGGFVQWNLGYLFFFRFPLLVSPVFFDKFFQHCWWKKLGASINTTCWFSHSEMIWIWFNSRLSRIWMVGGSFHPDTKTLGKMKPFWRVVFFKWVGWFNHQLGSADRGWVPRNECSQGKMALPYVLLRTVDSSQGLGVKIIGYSDWYWYWISVFLYRYNAHFSQKRNFVLLLDSISVLPSRTSVPQDRGIHLRLHHYCHRKEAEAWVVYPANVDHEQAAPAKMWEVASSSSEVLVGVESNKLPNSFGCLPGEMDGEHLETPQSPPQVVPHHCRSKRSGLWTDRLLQRRVARYHRVVQELNRCVMKKSQSSWLLVLSYVSESLDLQNEPK